MHSVATQHFKNALQLALINNDKDSELRLYQRLSAQYMNLKN
jgi:hypothetical protein